MSGQPFLNLVHNHNSVQQAPPIQQFGIVHQQAYPVNPAVNPSLVAQQVQQAVQQVQAVTRPPNLSTVAAANALNPTAVAVAASHAAAAFVAAKQQHFSSTFSFAPTVRPAAQSAHAVAAFAFSPAVAKPAASTLTSVAPSMFQQHVIRNRDSAGETGDYAIAVAVSAPYNVHNSSMSAAQTSMPSLVPPSLSSTDFGYQQNSLYDIPTNYYQQQQMPSSLSAQMPHPTAGGSWTTFSSEAELQASRHIAPSIIRPSISPFCNPQQQLSAAMAGGEPQFRPRHGASQNFRGKRGGAGSAGGNWKQSQQTSTYYCDTCKVSCAGLQTYNEHVEGQKHRKKVEALKSGGSSQPLPKTKTSYRCELCEITCTGMDTYKVHVQGARHMKTIKLFKQMGKPIPSAQPTVIPAQGSKTDAPPSATKIVKPVEQKSDVLDEIAVVVDDDNKEYEPIGEVYLEQYLINGKPVFHCKLCTCKFNDPTAKDLHLKGRRHRLMYKKKVDPSIEVEMKQTSNRKTNAVSARQLMIQRERQAYGAMMAMYRSQLMAPMPPPCPIPFGNDYFAGGFRSDSQPQPGFVSSSSQKLQESFDDRHVMAKHGLVQLPEIEFSSLHKFSVAIEQALKAISDHLFEIERENNAKRNEETPAEQKSEKSEKNCGEVIEKMNENHRMLVACLRVGRFAKTSLIAGDKICANLVMMCAEKPTMALLYKVYELLPKHSEKYTDEKFEMNVMPEKGCLILETLAEPKRTVMIHLTSTKYEISPDSLQEGDGKPSSPKSSDAVDTLDKFQCLETLRILRRTKWFQARCMRYSICVIVLRVLRNLSSNIPAWTTITEWMLEVLIEKAMSSTGYPLSPGDTLRRVFEMISAGIFLPGSTGILDPCEDSIVDLTEGFTVQQREDVTKSGQLALRLIAFGRMHKVLQMNKLPAAALLEISQRKRPLIEDDNDNEDIEFDANGMGKKDKREENWNEGEEENSTKNPSNNAEVEILPDSAGIGQNLNASQIQESSVIIIKGPKDS